MDMADETKKNEGPTCACGKGDLYEEWLKLNEDKKEEVSDSTNSNQAVDDKSLDDEAGKEDQKPVETKD
jgi:hypothetical protein